MSLPEPPPSSHPEAPAPVSLAEASRFWLKLGCLGFGGPAGQIAMLHRELVDERRWISEKRFLHALNYCMMLPGPEAQQLVVYIGWLMHRSWGGIVAGALFVLPAFLLYLVLGAVYVAYGQTPFVGALFMGLQPAVTAIVLQAVVRIGGRTLKNPWRWGLAIGAFVAIAAFKVPFPLVVLIAALLGWLIGRRVPGSMSGESHRAGSSTSTAPALIDDDTPPPAHALRGRYGLMVTFVSGIGVWAASLAAVFFSEVGQRALAPMAIFFSRIALVTFGGAYAVLPYVQQAAVNAFRWLTPIQMIDGLALAQVTPGPLIMVVSFVGYLGAHSNGVPGWQGALVATWFTFLPSTLIILATAPLVESTRRNPRIEQPLAGITSAVVGVIASLALFFVLHVGWPSGWGGPVHVSALAATAVATVLLIRFRMGILPLLGVFGLLGLLVGLFQGTLLR